MSLHAPSLHFHLGAWAVTAVCTFLAFWLNFMLKRGWIPEPIRKYIHPDTVARLDYVANITGLVGLAGVIVSAYFGFLDASQVPNVSPLDINAFFVGFNNVLLNPILTFKVQWTLVGAQAFVFGGIIRFYYVTYRKAGSVYDQHYVVQILYAESTLVGFFLMMLVAGAGGIWVYGESILSGIPILEDFLPGGNLTAPFVVITGAFAVLFILSAWFAEKTEQLSAKKQDSSSLE